jgi:hypothetical protein
MPASDQISALIATMTSLTREMAGSSLAGLIAAIASLATGIAALVTLIFIIIQARAVVRAIYGQTFTAIIVYAQSIRYNESLNRIRSLQVEDFDRWRDDRAAESIADFFNILRNL